MNDLPCKREDLEVLTVSYHRLLANSDGHPSGEEIEPDEIGQPAVVGGYFCKWCGRSFEVGAGTSGDAQPAWELALMHLVAPTSALVATSPLVYQTGCAS